MRTAFKIEAGFRQGLPPAVVICTCAGAELLTCALDVHAQIESNPRVKISLIGSPVQLQLRQCQTRTTSYQ